MSEEQFAKLIIDDQTVELPIYKGTMGPSVIDIRKLYSQTGSFTYDPGFLSTASCTSNITYVDGDKGELLYRGYPIEQLASNFTYLDICYLILNGDLPSNQESLNFKQSINDHMMVHEQMQFFLRGFRRDAHPMAILIGLVGAMSAFHDDDRLCKNNDEACKRALVAKKLIAKMPTLVAMAYKYSLGEPFVYPQKDLSYTDNFLRMMFAHPSNEYKVNEVTSKALDKIFILHADHEQNASTSTVRLCGSSGTSPFAAIASGVACLWGPSHGGANEACLQMLYKIQLEGGLSKIGEFINKVKNKEAKLMGFGHRIYKNYDPRAKIMQAACKEVLENLGLENDELFNLAMQLEKIALEDDYFIERKLYPNVDFYSGIIQKALGIPVELFTAIFAIARTVGWLAQWIEMITDSEYKIGRPRQLYKGPSKREVAKN